MRSRPENRESSAQPCTVLPLECRTELLLPSQVDFACRVFKKFLAGLSALLPGYLYAPATVRFASAEQRSFSEGLSAAEDAGCAVLLDLDPFPRHACITFGHSFLCAALETLLGAPAGVGGAPRESLTEVDLRILQGLIDLAIAELRSAWQSKCTASFRKAPANSVEFASVESDDQSALILTAEIAMRESTDTLRLILPSLLIRLISQSVRKSSVPGGDIQRRALLDAVSHASLDLEAVIRGADIRVRDLLALRPGMVLELPQKSGSPIECQINGVSKLRGDLVSNGNYMEFQIASRCESGD